MLPLCSGISQSGRIGASEHLHSLSLSALCGGEQSVSFTFQTLYSLWTSFPVTVRQEAGCKPTVCLHAAAKAITPTSAKDCSLLVQFVASSFTV